MDKERIDYLKKLAKSIYSIENRVNSGKFDEATAEIELIQLMQGLSMEEMIYVDELVTEIMQNKIK